MRISIIGLPGSRKGTFAQQVSIPSFTNRQLVYEILAEHLAVIPF